MAFGLIALVLIAEEGRAQSDAGAVTSARLNANASADPADARWVPGFSLRTGILVHERDGDTLSIERGTAEGDSKALFALFGASAEISTPRISALPTRPRFFARADFSYSVDNDEPVVGEGDPGNPIRNPENDVAIDDPVAGVVDVGTSLRVKSEPVILSGGLGLGFSREIAGRMVRLRPSLEWMYQRDEIALTFGAAESEGADPTRCAPCRAAAARGQTTKSYHSLGPGVEVDVDAARVGDFRVSMFARFAALRILGDREVNLDARGSWFTREDETINGQNIILSIDPAVGREDSVVRARFRRDPWSYAATAGIRIVWSPQ